MTQPTFSISEPQWRAMMLRAIASKCSKGMTDVNDADVLTSIADEIEAAEQVSATQ